MLLFVLAFFELNFTQQGPWVLGVTDRSSTPDVPPDLRAPEILPKPMELLENETRAKIYKERTTRVREYCKYMKNDSMINDWIEHPGNFLYLKSYLNGLSGSRFKKLFCFCLFRF